MGGRQRRPEPTRRRALLWGAVALPVTAGAGLAWWRAAPPARARGGAGEALGPTRPRRERRPTLDPARFVGKPRRAHRVARDLPDVLDQLYCYCECDRSVGHESLLSCYTDGHAPT
jgi:hypothetical protein